MAKKPVLVVMAAGMGSRYGGLKQIDPVGSHGEAILDYSLFDAHEAGFETAVIIIKEAIRQDFMDTVGKRLEQSPMEIRYAFQELDKLPEGCTVPDCRTKPWGTGHAVLCAKDVIGDAPFAVINSDDYYGKEGYKALYNALCNAQDGQYCMVGYELGKTVTDNGYVARGVCTADESGNLLYIQERTHIEVQGDAIRFTEDGENWTELAPDTTVSMNMWGFVPSFLKELESKFAAFMKTLAVSNPEKAEFFLPFAVDELLHEGKAKVKVLRSADKWYGVTYAADKPQVVAALRAMAEEGKYPDGLWNNEGEIHMNITNDIKYIGVNDHEVDLFEGQYDVPNGMAYNSYAIMDEKIAIMDTVDAHFTAQWLGNIAAALEGRKPDYLVVQHMEPDHSANIANFLQAYPEAVVVSSAKAFVMMKNFFGDDYADRRIVVGEGDTLSLGKHTLTFVTAPMVHWPEVIVTYDSYDKVLFSADGFGKFGALDADEPWDCEARRYYIGIVGKYGPQVQALLKKAATLDIAIICPLHGPILTEDLGHYIEKYDIWSSYKVESEGVVIAYTSVYGNTKKAVELLEKTLIEKGCPKVSVHDLARDDMAEAVEDSFRYGKLVLATTTYNGDVFPYMKTFIHHLTERNFQNRTVAMMENGTWAPVAAKVMTKMLEGSKNLTFTQNNVKILSALSDESKAQIEALAAELA